MCPLLQLKAQLLLEDTLLDRVDLRAQALALVVELHLLLLGAVQFARDRLADARQLLLLALDRRQLVLALLLAQCQYDTSGSEM